MKQNKITVSASGTLRKTTLRGIISLLLLLLTATSAWATDYVFVYNGNYLGVNAAGTGIENYTTFNPERCVWTCVNGNNEATLGGTSYALRITYNGNTRYLNGSTTNGNAPTLSTTAQNVWRTDGTYLFYRNSNNYYLYYRGGSWRTSRSTGNNDNSYAGTGWGATNYRATLTASTTTDAQDNTKLPTVTCSGLSGSAGLQMSQNGLGGTYTPAATTITVGGTTYYKGTNGVYSTTAPTATLNPTYTWSINSGNANITNAGVLTLSNNNTQNVRVRLTITNTNPAITKTVDYNLTATATAALNETAYGDMTITPSAQTLDLGQTVTYSASASINQLTRTRPQYVTITDPNGHTHYKVGDTYQAAEPAITETPGTTLNFTSFNWSAAGGGAYFTLDPYYSASSNQVTLTRSAQKTGTQQTFTISVTGVYGGQNKTASATVTIPATQVDLTALHAGAAINLGVGSSESINGHYTYEPDYDAAGAPYLKFKYISANTSVATVDESGKVTAVGPGSTTITVTAVKLDGTDGVTCNVTVNVTIDAPTISIDGSGNVTITHPVPGVQIRYTTNGTDPTATTGTVYTASFAAGNEQTIKAVAVANGVASPVASEFYATSGVSGSKVILNDYEDHTWTYYAGVDSEVDGGNYNTNYAGKIYSPNPRNIKITYYGNGKLANLTTSVTGVKVGVDADANTFIYYKTIENNGGYKYTTIPNPFSVRPKINSNYYGFVSWRVKSVTGGSITGYAVGSTINAESEITFVPTSTYTLNCTSMEVELEAVWDVAEVSTNGTFTKGYNSVERNFYVVSSSSNNNLPVVGTRCTYSSFYPNGTTNGTTAATMANRGTRRGNFTCTADSKVEYIILSYDDGTINADAYNLTIGRGCSPASGVSANLLYGMTGKTVNNPQFHLRVESGAYNYMSYLGGYYSVPAASTGNSSTITGDQTHVIVTMGSDYDRAVANGNNNLQITYAMMMGTSANQTNTTYTAFRTRTNRDNPHTLDLTIKSGKLGTSLFMETATGNTTYLQGGAGYGHYFSMAAGQTNVGRRNILMEGGETCTLGSGIDVKNNSATGGDANNTTTNRGCLSYNLRIKGGIVHGNVYGGAAQSPSGGNRVMVVTGGQVKGWFAAGCNGTSNDGGQNYGTSWVYIGGNGRIDSEGSTKTLGYAGGGNVYAAGAGRSGSTTCGEMTFGSNLVIADNSYIERGAYGGGNYGYTLASSNIYITGGTNAGNNDGVTGSKGGVYGGANQQDGPEIKIWMTGGKMLGGVYGGCNTSGTISGNVTMQINGGQVGTDATHTGNVHGGGYGDGTVVSGNVELTLGNLADERGAKIYGNVYGGSALGTTGGTGKHTYVTVNRGSITGNVFGGGMGETGSNTKGVVTGAIKVDVYGTDPKPTDGTYALYGVYGGGDLAPYSGTPLVTVHNCDNSIEYVYGGGNATSVAGTDVTIWGGNKIGNVFGGGNGQVRAANISGSTNVKIYGGTIENVFPGSNTNGTIGGNLNLTIEKHAGTDGCEGDGMCPFDLGNVYSGGNKAASIIGNVTIGCLGNGDKITNLFGGAKQANVTGDVNLLITGNHIKNVFGGNDISGQPSGTITVVVDWDPTCTGAYLGNVYGGGRDASYEAPNGNKDYPQVFVRNAVVEHDVFGGGLGESALVTGNPQVTVSTQCTTPGHTNDHMVHIKGSLYGGGSAAPVTGNPVVNTKGLSGDTKKVQIDNHVFGGGFGQSAVVTGNTEVNIKGNTVVNKNVYGGGNGGLVTGNTNIVIGD